MNVWACLDELFLYNKIEVEYMNEHDSTRYLFAQSIKDLMAKQSLDKMTVTDIVKHSGMTRQTFYRYFKDKYDLVNWYFEKLADKSFRQIGNSFNFTGRINQEIYFFVE